MREQVKPSSWEPKVRLRKSASGFTLIELLSALLIGGALTYVAITGVGTTLKQNKLAAEIATKERIRIQLRLALNCTNTVAALDATCPAGTPIELLGASGQVLVAKTKTAFFDSMVAAYCSSVPKEFDVQVLLPGKADYEKLFFIPLGCP